MENDTQVAAATNADETVELDLTNDDTEDIDALRQRLAAAEEAKRQLTARARRAEAAAKAGKPEPSATAAAPSQFDEEYAELRLDGYSRDEAKALIANGGRKALEDENSIVALGIKARREQAKALAAASQATPATGASEIERRFTTEQLAAMSVADLEKVLPRA